MTLKTSFLLNSARVLKKGARFYGLEWIELPNYDRSNATHRDLLQRSSTILGTSMPCPISTWTDALEVRITVVLRPYLFLINTYKHTT